MIRDQIKVPVGYLWIKKDKQGREFLGGVISLGLFGEVPIVVFKEDNKTNEKAADYIIKVATVTHTQFGGEKE